MNANANANVCRADLEQLAAFFLDGGILAEQVVQYSISALFSLVDEACDPGSGGLKTPRTLQFKI